MLEDSEEERKQNLQEEKVYFSRDVYAFAISLIQFIKRKPPTLDTHFNGVSEFRDLILDGERPSLPKNEVECPSSLAKLTRDCWQKDPALRPSFQEILRRLEKEVLVDCAIFDEYGRQFWKDSFYHPGDSKEVLQTNVSWKEFIPKFLKTFDARKMDEKDVEIAVFKELVSHKNSVSLENFGRIVGYFFPLVPILNLKSTDAVWLRKVSFTVKKPWFFGDIDKDGAFKQLKKQNREGDFILRFSNGGSNWTLSYIGQKNKVFHTRVIHPPSSIHFTMEGKNASTFDSLEELVSSLQSTELISQVCEGSPFESFFTEASQLVEQGYAELDFSN